MRSRHHDDNHDDNNDDDTESNAGVGSDTIRSYID
jgi:hypothetical protein